MTANSQPVSHEVKATAVRPSATACKVLGATFIGMALSHSAIFAATFSLFVQPLSNTFGWSPGDISVAFAIERVTVIVAAPLLGAMLDRTGVRRLLLPGIAMLAALMAALSLMSGSILSLYVLYVLIGAVGVITSPVTYSRVIIGWFDAHRGLALGVATSGVGIGIALWAPFTEALISNFGWRDAYRGLALALVLVMLPVAWLWVREPLQRSETLAAGSPRQDTVTTLLQWRTGLICLSFGLIGLCTTGMLPLLVPIIADHGLERDAAAQLVSFIGLALIGGRLVSGWLIDRLYAPFVVALLTTSVAAGIALLIMSSGSMLLTLAVVLIGVGIGAETDVLAYIVSRYFPQGAFGRVFGLAFAIMALGSALGSLVLGYGVSWTGSYDPPLIGLLGAALVSSLPLFLLGGYREHRTS